MNIVIKLTQICFLLFLKQSSLTEASRGAFIMKILQINSVCGIRSTGRICTDIAQMLDSNGHECRIAYGREAVPRAYERYAHRIGREFDVRLHALESRVFDNTGHGSRRSTRRLIEWIKAFDPDVIHLHNLHGYYINIALLFEYLKESDKPVVWTLHDCWTFTGHCTHFDYVKCNQWKSGCRGRCPQKKRYPASLLADRSKQNYIIKRDLFTGVKNLTVVSPSRWLAELVKKSFLAEYPIEVIPNGIDTVVFKPTASNIREKYGIGDQKIVLGVASVWDERKGLYDFVKLAEMIGKGYRIVMVGLTEAQKKKLTRDIIGISRTNSARELAELYTAADVLVNPTYEDNYPSVNLEAQACGTPVITYRTGGSVESVTEENTVEQGDFAGLLQAIYSLSECLTQPSLFKGFDSHDMAEAYMKLYESVRKNDR